MKYYNSLCSLRPYIDYVDYSCFHLYVELPQKDFWALEYSATFSVTRQLNPTSHKFDSCLVPNLKIVYSENLVLPKISVWRDLHVQDFKLLLCTTYITCWQNDFKGMLTGGLGLVGSHCLVSENMVQYSSAQKTFWCDFAYKWKWL